MSITEQLSSIRLFARLSPLELERVSACGEFKAYSRGDTIFNEGDPGTHLYCIVAGRVGISCRLGDESEQVPVHAATEGSVFGEFALFNDEARTATARALKDTRIFYVSANELRDMFSEAPAIGYRVMENLCGILVGRMNKTTRELRSSLMW